MATDCTQCVSYEDCKPHMTNASHKTPDCESFEQKAPVEPICPGCAGAVANGGHCAGWESKNDEGVTRCPEFTPPNFLDESMDLLCDMFERQAALNKKYGFVPGGMMVRQDRRDLHDGKWLNDFITAMVDELGELRDCTIWKHWYKEAREGKRFMLTDREHAKVEVVDLMFFLMSMAQAVGLTAPEFYGLYIKKLTLNHERRDDDCTQQEAKDYKLEPSDG